MKTELEPIAERMNLEEGKNSGGFMPVVLWFVALVCVVGAFLVYQKVSSRHILPPPPPVDVKSPRQVNELTYKFNDLVRTNNWDEAQKLLSAEAAKKLADSKLTFRESFMAQRKNSKDETIQMAERTPEEPQVGDTSVTVNNVYFIKKPNAKPDEKIETMYVPLTIVQEKVGEQDRLAIGAWGTDPAAKPSPAASASPEAKK